MSVGLRGVSMGRYSIGSNLPRRQRCLSQVQCPSIKPRAAKVQVTALAIFAHALRAIGISMFGREGRAASAHNKTFKF